MSNAIRASDVRYSVRYDIIDWREADGRIARRRVVRVVFRNIDLADELSLLHQAGFERVDLLGGFDGRAFDRDQLTTNQRLVARCQRAAV